MKYRLQVWEGDEQFLTQYSDDLDWLVDDLRQYVTYTNVYGRIEDEDCTVLAEEGNRE